MEHINQFFDLVESALKEHEGNKVLELLDVASEKTKIKRNQILVGGVAVVLLLVLFVSGMSFISSLVGFSYPAYCSFKALETQKSEDDTKWLIYWIVYGVFSVMEHFSDVILFWFPFYFEIKIALLVWCMYPVEHNGSMVIYHKVLRPMFLKHEKKLDSAVKDAVKTAVSAATATAGAVGAPDTVKQD